MLSERAVTRIYEERHGVRAVDRVGGTLRLGRFLACRRVLGWILGVFGYGICGLRFCISRIFSELSRRGTFYLSAVS